MILNYQKSLENINIGLQKCFVMVNTQAFHTFTLNKNASCRSPVFELKQSEPIY